MSMAINFGRVGIYNEEFPSTKSSEPLITWFCFIITTIRRTVSKLGKVVTYYKKIQPIKSRTV